MNYENVKLLNNLNFNLIGVFKKCISKATPIIKREWFTYPYIRFRKCIKNQPQIEINFIGVKDASALFNANHFI